MDAERDRATRDSEYARHAATYDAFVRGVVIFTAHVVVVLLLLAYFLV